MSNQIRTLVAHFARKKTITNREAISEYRIMALPRRISDMEEQGFRFRRHQKVNKATGQRYVKYECVAFPTPAALVRCSRAMV